MIAQTSLPRSIAYLETWRHADGREMYQQQSPAGDWMLIDGKTACVLTRRNDPGANAAQLTQDGFTLRRTEGARIEPETPEAIAAPTITRQEARKEIHLSAFMSDHDNSGRKWQTYRADDGQSNIGPRIVASYDKGLWDVESYQCDCDGYWGYERLMHNVSKKEATDYARELAITDYLLNVREDNAPTYADLPPVGGGSQALDNARAERNARTEAYHAHATAQAVEVADTLTELGFIDGIKHEVDGTPVTYWYNDRAYVKQTPYTLKAYNASLNGPTIRFRNGRPCLPKTADAELVNRIQHGWCQRGEATGYAAGIVAALLPLIETPDPYMQALDAMDQGESAVEMTAWGNGPWYSESIKTDPAYPTISGGSQENEKHALFRRWMSYPDARHIPDASNEAVLQQARAVRTDMLAYESANPGAWTANQLEGFTAEVAEIDERLHLYPTISGGSHELTADDYCLIDGCERPATHTISEHGNRYAYCDQHPTGYEITTHEQIAARRQQAFIDTGKAYDKITNKCPGFYSSQAGAHLRCTERKLISAEYCDGCQKAIAFEQNVEMKAAHADQWGR